MEWYVHVKKPVGIRQMTMWGPFTEDVAILVVNVVQDITDQNATYDTNRLPA